MTILVMAGLLIIAIMVVATAKQVLIGEKKSMDVFVRQAAKEIASEASALSAVGQGVRYYALNWPLTVKLYTDRVEVAYADDKGNISVHTYTHTLPGANVLPAEINGPVRMCISKKLEGCTPVFTICKEKEACCTISPSTCVYSG